MVLDSLEVKNFTVFPDARLRFAGGLNVIVGENGLGKTHLLKLPYAVMAVSAEEAGSRTAGNPPRPCYGLDSPRRSSTCSARRAWVVSHDASKAVTDARWS